MNQAIRDNQQFIYFLFNITAAFLIVLSKLTFLSYQFWNIVIWFGVIPALWIAMVGKRISAWLNIISVVIFIYLFTFHTWNLWFEKAVILLNKMAAYLHSDYKAMSVYVCVFLPLAVFMVLSWLCLSNRGMKRSFIIAGCLCLVIIILFPISNLFIQHFSGYIKSMSNS